MERDHRPVSHRRTRRIGSRIGFLVCFNWGTSSSSSSSSMKISRSILSPGRRDSNLSLSSSLSRRLRSNGSLKGGAGACGQASPMFPVTGSNKKKGLGFEIDEPSSPKVTCIGLVRVKTKTKHGNNKKKQKMRTRSKRRSGGGEASFRKIEQNQEGMNHHHQPECLPHRNHRWIHLPFTICEGLKALGAELNCFVLCSGRSSSSSSSSFSSCNWGSEREKRREKKRRRCGSRVMSSSSCGAVFMRWLFALEDNNEHRKEDRDFHVVAADNETGIHEVSEQKGREFIEAMADKEVEEEEEERRVADEEVEEEEEEEGRVSICVPPRNALLLMRCRSEPFRTSSLATRFWDDSSSSSSCNNLKADESNEEHYEEKLQQVVVAEEEDKPLKKELPGEENKEEEIGVISRRVSVSAREEQENLIKEDDDDDEQHQVDQDEEEKEVKKEENPENAGTEEEAVIVAEAHELRNSEKEVLEEEEEEGFNVPAIAENSKLQEDKTSKCENGEQRRLSFSSSTIPILLPQPVAHDLVPEPATLPPFGLKIEEKVANLEEERAQMWNNEEKLVTQKQEEEEEEEIQEPSFEPEQEEQSNSQTLKEEEEEEEEEGRRSEDGNRAASDQVLPECLLLMMCEPKVSMEVSKETWVCSNDFIRHHRNNLHHHHQQQLPPEKQQQEVIVKKIRGADEPKKQTYANHQLRQLKQKKPRDHKIMSAAAAAAPQPPRSSCSKVEPLVVAIEKKLVSGSKAPEPFVLTRCKSEPMRSSDKLAPEACFWKNMKLEPHRQTTLSVGATEVGF